MGKKRRIITAWKKYGKKHVNHPCARANTETTETAAANETAAEAATDNTTAETATATKKATKKATPFKNIAKKTKTKKTDTE